MLFLAAVLASNGSCLAQAPLTGFDVVSIRPSKADEPWYWNITEDGRMLARNVTLKDLLMLAYRLQEFQIVGGPGWISRDQFDIQAKLENSRVTDEQSRHMIRNLLEQRFRLTAHMETGPDPFIC